MTKKRATKKQPKMHGGFLFPLALQVLGKVMTGKGHCGKGRAKHGGTVFAPGYGK